MDRRIESSVWTSRRVSILVLVLMLVASSTVLFSYLKTPRLRVEKDKLTIDTVRRGVFQESILAGGAVRAGDSSPEVLASISRYEAARLVPGQKGKAEVEGETYALEVARIGLAESNDVDVLFRFAGTPPAVSPGQKLNIRLLVGEPSQALLINRGAFFQTTGGHWIWVVDEEDGTAVKREIQLGRQNLEQHEVVSGLQIGERVLISTYDHLDGVEELVLTESSNDQSH